MAFCICIQVCLKHFSVVTILSFLEYLLQSNVSVHMIVNYLSTSGVRFSGGCCLSEGAVINAYMCFLQVGLEVSSLANMVLW